MNNKLGQIVCDFLSGLIVLLIYSGTFLSALAIGEWVGMDALFQSISWKPLGISLSVVFYFCLWLFLLPVFIFGIRIIIPNVKEGTYNMPSTMTLTWFIHLALSRVIYLIPIHYLVYFFSILRFLYLRALGCHNSFGVNTSASVSITDFPLITIEGGAFVGDKATISGHRISLGKLMLNKVHIGKSCMVHAFAIVGPGTYMEEGSIVGVRSTTCSCYLEKDSQVQNNSAAIEVRVPRGKTYVFMPLVPEESKNPQFEDYTPG